MSLALAVPLRNPKGIPAVKRTLVFAACILVSVGSGRIHAGGDPAPRVVILGFDGADPKLTEQFMAEGKLPNLARLKAEGSYLRLATTNPPQTPVSWSTFATGINPGRTQI